MTNPQTIIHLLRDAHRPADLAKLMDDAAEMLSRIPKAMALLERVAGKEIGIHHPGDGFINGTDYYTSWNDGEYWIKQTLGILKGEYDPRRTETHR